MQEVLFFLPTLLFHSIAGHLSTLIFGAAPRSQARRQELWLSDGLREKLKRKERERKNAEDKGVGS